MWTMVAAGGGGAGLELLRVPVERPGSLGGVDETRVSLAMSAALCVDLAMREVGRHRQVIIRINALSRPPGHNRGEAGSGGSGEEASGDDGLDDVGEGEGVGGSAEFAGGLYALAAEGFSLTGTAGPGWCGDS